MLSRRTRTFLATSSVVALLLTACGGDDGGAATDPEESGAGTGEADGTAATEDDTHGFDADLVAAAQEEGEVVLYGGGHTREGLELLVELFEEDFGITVNFVREDSGSTVQMVEAELAGGELNADVVSLTDAPSLLRWSAEGTIVDIEVPNEEQLLEAAQVDDPFVPYSLVPLGIMYNESTTDEVPQRWEDLTAEDFDAVIVMADPSASGTALMFVEMMTDLMGEDWWDDLAERNVIVTDSALALAQMVITGEADYGIPAIESAVVAAAQGGEPLAIDFLEEGVPTFTSAVALMADAPRSNAGELLVQYHVSERFQEAMVGIGARTVLEEGAQPEGQADFSDSNLLAPDFEALAEDAEDLRADFDQRFR